MRRRFALRTIALVPLVAMCGCAGYQSALDPASPQASQVYTLWWALFIIAVVVWVAVMLVFAAAIWRRRRTPPENEPRVKHTVQGAVVVTVVVLLGILFASVILGGSISPTQLRKDYLDIEVTGHQWWWEVNYADRPVDQRVSTANEIHVPVNKPIRLRLTSTDVIHSLWVPNLNGKTDLIPSRTNLMIFEANRPGVYRGQCAEFCGFQHAHMALLVIAEDEKKFAAWYANQQKPAATPATQSGLRGQDVFLNSPCVVCHTIRGTPAAARFGPDLTHIASRATIAAGTLPNTRGNLGGWIVDSQHIKPGNHMPVMSLPAADLDPLIDYLESLQ